MSALLTLVIASLAVTTTASTAQETEADPCAGVRCAGAASIDTTWPVGSGHQTRVTAATRSGSLGAPVLIVVGLAGLGAYAALRPGRGALRR